MKVGGTDVCSGSLRRRSRRVRENRRLPDVLRGQRCCNNLGGITGYTAHHGDAGYTGFTASTLLPAGPVSVFTGTGSVYPSAINDFGTIVGHSGDTVFAGWQRLANGQMLTVSDPLANDNPNKVPDGGYGGTAPGGINDLGIVVGAYFDKTGIGRGFIATPVR